jgi:ribonuclease P protein component
MQRLHQASDIANIFAKIKPQYLDSFQVYLIKNNLEEHRIGIIIAKKHIPLAIDRNRLKRQIRELFRKNLITKIYKYDILVLIRAKVNLEQKTILLKQIQDYINKLS